MLNQREYASNMACLQFADGTHFKKSHARGTPVARTFHFTFGVDSVGEASCTSVFAKPHAPAQAGMPASAASTGPSPGGIRFAEWRSLRALAQHGSSDSGPNRSAEHLRLLGVVPQEAWPQGPWSCRVPHLSRWLAISAW